MCMVVKMFQSLEFLNILKYTHYSEYNPALSVVLHSNELFDLVCIGLLWLCKACKA